MEERIRMNYRIYLAGPIDGLNYNETEEWRLQFTGSMAARRDITCLTPMRGKDYLKDKPVITGQYHYPMSTAKAITGRDRNDATTCHLLVVNMLGAKKVSIGTVMEMAWADAHRIPILLIMEKEGNIHEHKMLTEVITFRVDNVAEAAEIAQIMFPS